MAASAVESMNRNQNAAARRQLVLERLGETGAALTVDELSALFGVSVATVRRDLEKLDRAGLVTRTHGGAIVGSLRAEKTIREREDRNAAGKEAVARAAAAMVTPSSTVFLDAGTTTARLIRHLSNTEGLTIVTNGLNSVNALVEAESSAKLIVVGGLLRSVNQALLGPLATSSIQSMFADFAFIGADCVHPLLGISSRSAEQNELKALMMKRSRRPVILADSSKIGADWSSHWLAIKDSCELITDDGVSDAALAAFGTDSGLHPLVAPKSTGNSVPQPNLRSISR
ncbi:DeoR/GlpR family DNA-binding transcription regulator [Microcella pacifica]|jgi:DeoR family fructose operon transcriptional repressor|uniref:DeoR/GlpR family DNA-binding transcription regulator n=1 Tax=Microcella pacifica TaxID=2591847 RepID=UPI003314F5A7